LPLLNSHCFGFFESRSNSNPSSYNTWDTLHSTKLFGLVASSWEAINQVLFKVEVFLFYKFYVENACRLDPLKWWISNEIKILNVGFLVG
jgi:hypothetical protein